jgi:glutamyl-tRNA synthetase
MRCPRFFLCATLRLESRGSVKSDLHFSNMIVVRFAPSPTGYLHIGGARTAIFNWLFAKKHGGTFYLRIEDTDQARSGEEMTRAILESLRWLGIDWQGEPLHQSSRFPEYQKFAHQLLREDKAYRCFCTPEELAAARERAQAEKKNFRYDGKCRHLSAEESERRAKSEERFAIRFIVPQEGATAFDDQVHGNVSFENTTLDDFVILRSDGLPTYHLAVVVDDHAMGITHIIRGDDHISNTPKQVLLYRAFGWEMPVFAHVPLILGPDKSRLSKRHGATAVGEYQRKGILPEALFNFLALLGWSPGDDREVISREALIQLFDLSGISTRNAVFDEKKLQWMNSQYLAQIPAELLVPLVAKAFIEAGIFTQDWLSHHQNYFAQVVELLEGRMRLIPEFVEFGSYFFREPVEFEASARDKHWKAPETAEWLSAVAERLNNLTMFTVESTEAAIRAYAEELGINAGKLIHPARLALTGFGVSPGLFEVMSLLGKEKVVARLKKAAGMIEQSESVVV